MFYALRTMILAAIVGLGSAMAYSSLAQDATNDDRTTVNDPVRTTAPADSVATRTDADRDGFDYGWLGLAGLVGLLGLMPRDRRERHDAAAISKAVNR